jgi:Tfp pilus assembly protein PilN
VCVGVVVKRGQVHAAEANLIQVVTAMDHTRTELEKLDDLLKLEAECRQRDQVLTKLGLHVESSRLVNKLAEVMPSDMAVLDLDIAIEQTKPQASAIGRAAESAAKDVPPDRRMKVRLKGVAPTDVDLANFLRELSNVAFFDNVAMTYAKDRSDSGHVMREYEVTFSLNLNGAAVN